MEPLTRMTDDRAARRDLLKLAAGLGLSFALPGLAPHAAGRRGVERPKSLIRLWLEGGPSQLETWDPHPGTAIGGPTRAIKTTIEGVAIAADFPRLAEQLHHLSVIRSLVSNEGDHERGVYVVRTGYRPDPTVTHPSLGSIITRELPGPGLEIPPFISLGYNERPSRGGYLGGRFDALHLHDADQALARLRGSGSDERQRRRLENLQILTDSFAQGREAAVEKTLYRNSLDSALRMMTSEQLAAFDVSAEPQAVREAYGGSPFGRACLIARRLVEQGVRVIEIALLNFDTHENNFATNRELAAILDPACAALIVDLARRDLLESTVLLCLGEFGRTPTINPKDGRDHWPAAFSCLVGGGRLKPGVLIGATDPTGARREPDDPIRIPDLYATILSTFGVNPAQEVVTPVGRPIKYSDGSPIQRLLT
jgi:hypothetical protein